MHFLHQMFRFDLKYSPHCDEDTKEKINHLEMGGAEQTGPVLQEITDRSQRREREWKGTIRCHINGFSAKGKLTIGSG